LLSGSKDGIRVIRRQWRHDRWYFSVVDVIAVLTDSETPGTYWRVLKHRLQQEGASETVSNCNALKMLALDGKMRLTDTADAETMLRIIQSVPSPKAEPVKQWLARVGAQRLDEAAAELTEDQRRQLLRGEIAEKNTSLAETARGAGVIITRDFAIFQDYGYMGLYNGEKARDIAARKGLARGEAVLDWMGGEELAANWFRITQTEAKLRRDGVRTKPESNATHYTVGRAVRGAIAGLGGDMPETLPTPEKSTKQIEREERERLMREAEERRQPSLLDPEE
jgi:DNA-damage-inducible protein D